MVSHSCTFSRSSNSNSSSSESWFPQTHPQQFIQTIPQSSFELAKIRVGIAALPLRIAPRQLERQKGLIEESKRRQHLLGAIVVSQKDGGTVHWNATGRMIPWPTARPPIRNDSKLFSVVLLSMWSSDQIQTQVPKRQEIFFICLEGKCFQASSWATALHTGGGWTGDWLIAMPQTFASKGSSHQNWDSPQPTENTSSPCADGAPQQVETSLLEPSVTCNQIQKTMTQRATSKQATISHQHLVLSNPQQRRTNTISGAWREIFSTVIMFRSQFL